MITARERTFVRTLVREAIDRAREDGTTMWPATVQSAVSAGSTVTVALDGDSGTSISAQSLTGQAYGAGQRVMVALVPPHGVFIIGVVGAPTGQTDGWTAAGEAWTYASADAPSYTFTVPADVTTKYSAGMRVKFTQSGTVKYGIITAVSTYSGGNTTITVLMSMTGGTVDNSGLANSAISDNYYSVVKAPQGFPCDPLRWTVEWRSAADATQNTPTANTWYNPGTTKLDVPIGSWRLFYQAIAEMNKNPSTQSWVEVSLSTTNNSETDSGMTAFVFAQVLASGNAAVYALATREKYVLVAAKTTFYLIERTGTASASLIKFKGGSGDTIIRAVSAYL